MARTNEQITAYAAENNTIEERDLLNMKSRLNRGADNGEARELENLQPYVTPEQSAKGFVWLLDKYQTPGGRERKNNPFGYREIEALEWAREYGAKFRFEAWMNVGNPFRAYYVPVYTLETPNSDLSYYVHGGEIQYF